MATTHVRSSLPRIGRPPGIEFSPARHVLPPFDKLRANGFSSAPTLTRSG
jgi:hypothetical protein